MLLLPVQPLPFAVIREIGEAFSRSTVLLGLLESLLKAHDLFAQVSFACCILASSKSCES